MENLHLIPEIVQRLEALSLQIDNLENQYLNQVPPSSPPQPPRHRQDSPSQAEQEVVQGDYVCILNNRNGLRGKIVLVTRTTATRVFFKINGREVWRARHNVRKQIDAEQ